MIKKKINLDIEAHSETYQTLCAKIIESDMAMEALYGYELPPVSKIKDRYHNYKKLKTPEDDMEKAQLILSGHCPDCFASPDGTHAFDCPVIVAKWGDILAGLPDLKEHLYGEFKLPTEYVEPKPESQIKWKTNYDFTFDPIHNTNPKGEGKLES